jgi:hypothetical protein
LLTTILVIKRNNMKKTFLLFILALNVMLVGSSCTKETETKFLDKYLAAKDTTLTITAKSWDAFSFQTLALIDSGSTTYSTTPEGIKFHGQAYRRGARLQTKTALPFDGKSLYYKWKGNGDGQFAGFVVQIKYDPFSNDNTPAIQGVDLNLLTSTSSYNGSIIIQEDTWYYTRITPVSGTNNFKVTTSTGNYNNMGGVVIETAIIPIYTKHGYLAFRIGDNFSPNAYAVLGEVKIAD